MRPWLLRADQCRTLTLRIIEESLKLPPRLWRLAHRSTRGAGAQRRCLDTNEKDAHRIAAPHARAAQGTLPVHRLRGHGPGAKRGPLNACKTVIKGSVPAIGHRRCPPADVYRVGMDESPLTEKSVRVTQSRKAPREPTRSTGAAMLHRHIDCASSCATS
jgi:hypothetical protein